MAECPITGAHDDAPAAPARCPVTGAQGAAAPVVEPTPASPIDAEAIEYLDLLLREEVFSTAAEHARRLGEIQAEIARTGTYWQTTDELTHGAKVAWRNASRCIGRLTWQNLDVRDLRTVHTAAELFDHLVS